MQTTADTPELHLKRGELYLHAEHPQEALSDFQHALKLAPTRKDIHYYSQAELALGKTSNALLHVNLLLQHANSNAARARAFKLRGDIFYYQHKFRDAAIDHSQTIELKGKEALPDDFVRVADTYLEADNDNAMIAVDWLNRGIKELGSLAVLEERALSIETDHKIYDAALMRIDRLLSQGQRLPFLYYQKGEILDLKGEHATALASFRQALAALDEIPPTRRNTPAMMQFRNKIQTRIQ
jgi:tetratricopeptide (TPR) repeat protein